MMAALFCWRRCSTTDLATGNYLLNNFSNVPFVFVQTICVVVLPVATCVSQVLREAVGSWKCWLGIDDF